MNQEKAVKQQRYKELCEEIDRLPAAMLQKPEIRRKQAERVLLFYQLRDEDHDPIWDAMTIDELLD